MSVTVILVTHVIIELGVVGWSPSCDTGCTDSLCHFLMLAEYYPDAETELYAVHVVVYYYIPDHYLKC